MKSIFNLLHKKNKNSKNVISITEPVVKQVGPLSQDILLEISTHLHGSNFTKFQSICKFFKFSTEREWKRKRKLHDWLLNAIICGQQNTCFTTFFGSKYIYGTKDVKQENQNSIYMSGKNLNPSKNKVVIAGNSRFTISPEGTVIGEGNNSLGQLGLGTLQFISYEQKINIDKVKNIYTNGAHTLFLKKDGTVFGSGLNAVNQLGLGIMRYMLLIPTIVEIDDVFQIALGQNYTIFLKKDGTVWACGENSLGQLGQGHDKNCIVPTKINALDNEKIIAVFAGNNHTLFINDQYEVFGCGSNSYEKLGLDKSIQVQLTPIKLSINLMNEKDESIKKTSSFSLSGK